MSRWVIIRPKSNWTVKVQSVAGAANSAKLRINCLKGDKVALVPKNIYAMRVQNLKATVSDTNTIDLSFTAMNITGAEEFEVTVYPATTTTYSTNYPE